MHRALPTLLVALASIAVAVASVAAWWWLRESPPDDRTLGGLPHVASIEGAPAPRADRTVIHLRDWHLVPRELFDRDVESEGGRDLSKDELDRLYGEHLDTVEAVQKQIEDIIRELAAR